MNFQEYCDLAARTDAPMTQREGFAHAATMLYNELYEVATCWNDEMKIAEIGDCLWAIAKLARVGGEMFDITWPTERIDDYNRNEFILQMMEAAQKNFQGHQLRMYSFQLEWLMGTLAHELPDGMTLEECAAANIEKLKKRYPEGFSVERSVNRNDIIDEPLPGPKSGKLMKSKRVNRG